MTLDQFLNQRIFSTLGMSDTHFYPPETKLSRVATNYTPKTTERGVTPVPRPAQVNTRYFSGAGGLSSTAADYLRFCQMSLNGGELNGLRLLSRKSVEAMTVNHIGDLKGWLVPPGVRFGLGYAVLTDLGEFQGLGSVGSYWWGGAFGTTFWIDPKEQMIGIMMIQLRPYSHIAIRSQFRTLATQAIVD
jgi:CubicO group peptidase (beta-lactamase class C family)